MNHDWTTLLAGTVGSTAYGLNTAESDVDTLAVAAAPTAAFHGLHGPVESHVTTNPDVTVHEAAKYARLALKCNPTVTELMWLDEYTEQHPLGTRLVEIRGAFLSSLHVRNAYLGYATQQFERLKRRGDGTFSADTRKRTAKHARHLARLCDQGYQVHAYGRLRIRLDMPQWYLDFGERVAEQAERGEYGEVEALIASTEANFNDTKTVLPDYPDVLAVEDWLLRVRSHFYERGTGR